MARDKQIFVRTTEDVYDWVVAQATATGMSNGGVVAKILDEAKRRDWNIIPGQIVEGSPGRAEAADGRG